MGQPGLGGALPGAGLLWHPADMTWEGAASRSKRLTPNHCAQPRGDQLKEAVLNLAAGFQAFPS